MMKMKDKYSMTREQSVFWARRNIVDTLWRSARLEGLAITFPQTETIFNEGILNNIPFAAVVILNNLKRAWTLILEHLDFPMDYDLICRIHAQVGNGDIQTPGRLRKEPVRIGGTSWKPEDISEMSFKMALAKTLCEECATKRAIDTMLLIMRAQPFWDGNKRTASLVANHILVSNGRGVLSIPVDRLEEFKTLLIEFYETDSSAQISEFLYTECIDGANFDTV